MVAQRPARCESGSCSLSAAANAAGVK